MLVARLACVPLRGRKWSAVLVWIVVPIDRADQLGIGCAVRNLVPIHAAKEGVMPISPISRAVIAALALAPAMAFAITDDEVNTGVQFNFSNPGARSLALGGAFTGLADDATAAYANPAGLTILRTQEFGVELRHNNFDTPFASGGMAVTNPFSHSGVGSGSSSDSVTQASFASWVYPTERATFALYYHRLGDFESRFSADAIEFVDGNGNPESQALAKNTRLSYQIENLGAAVGFKVSDSFSLGLNVAYSDFSISSRTERFRDDQTSAFNVQQQSGGDNDVIFTLGALWQISSQWNLGLAYRSGGSFNYRSSNVLVDSGDRLDFTPDFSVPNVFSAGLAYRPSDALLFTLDVNRIEYSRLTDHLETIFNEDTPVLKIDDGTEVRLGMEYALLEASTPVFLRAGVWRDPDHRLAYAGPRPSNCIDFGPCSSATLYPKGSDETHYSLGIGWSFEKFQLDFAADLSDLVDTFSASGVVRF
jgi:long-chain fatty acid transport protein